MLTKYKSNAQLHRQGYTSKLFSPSLSLSSSVSSQQQFIVERSESRVNSDRSNVHICNPNALEINGFLALATTELNVQKHKVAHPTQFNLDKCECILYKIWFVQLRLLRHACNAVHNQTMCDNKCSCVATLPPTTTTTTTTTAPAPTTMLTKQCKIQFGKNIFREHRLSLSLALRASISHREHSSSDTLHDTEAVNLFMVFLCPTQPSQCIHMQYRRYIRVEYDRMWR